MLDLWKNEKLKLEICVQMRAKGGLFAETLSESILEADEKELAKIERVFGKYIERFAKRR